MEWSGNFMQGSMSHLCLESKKINSLRQSHVFPDISLQTTLHFQDDNAPVNTY